MGARPRPPLLLFSLLSAPAWASPPCLPPPVVQLSVGNCTIPAPIPSNLRDVHSWGIRFAIAGADDLCLVPSTVVNHTFLTTDALCGSGQLVDATGVTMTTAQCRSRRGGPVPAQSLPAASTDGLAQANPGWTGVGNAIDAAAQATLKLFDHSVTMAVGLIKTGQQSTASHLGLASGSVFLQALKDAGLIGARSFGLNVGSQSVLFPRRGNLILGGYDQASVAASSFVEYNIADPDTLNDRRCPLQVTITGLELIARARNSNDPVTKTTNTRENPVRFCIEPYDNLFRMPNNTVDDIRHFVESVSGYSGQTVGPTAYRDKLLNLEPGVVYPASSGSSFNGTMRLTIENDLTVDIPFYELDMPLRGLDEQGNPVLDPDYRELQIYGSAASGDAPVLGKAFLSQVYLVVDYESKKFKLAPQTAEATGTTPVPASSASCPTVLSPEDKGLIAIGVVLGALLVALALFLLLCRRSWPDPMPVTVYPRPDPVDDLGPRSHVGDGGGVQLRPLSQTGGSPGRSGARDGASSGPTPAGAGRSGTGA